VKRNSKPKGSAAATGGDERLARLGRELRKHREAVKLTQGELARRIGKSTATISKIESARQPLDMSTLLAITDELRVPPEQLLLRIELSRKSATPLQRRVLDVLRKTMEKLEGA
jgi:transcriptional regulator with XRE-family HTH domain